VDISKGTVRWLLDGKPLSPKICAWQQACDKQKLRQYLETFVTKDCKAKIKEEKEKQENTSSDEGEE
jgi:hypothetical protein